MSANFCFYYDFGRILLLFIKFIRNNFVAHMNELLERKKPFQPLRDGSVCHTQHMMTIHDERRNKINQGSTFT